MVLGKIKHKGTQILLNLPYTHFFCNLMQTFSSLFSYMALVKPAKSLKDFDKYYSLISQIHFIPVLEDLVCKGKKELIFQFWRVATDGLF